MRSEEKAESGGEHVAVQTLRVASPVFFCAKRLDCGAFSTAFECSTFLGNMVQKANANTVLKLAFLGFLLLTVNGCNTVRPLPPANLSEPGWTVRQGQAVWKRSAKAPEVAGEILLATKTDGSAFVQLSKNPFPLLTAQSTSHTWQVEIPTENKRYSGHGNPPARLIFLYLPRARAGLPPPKGWSWQKLADGGWRIENHSTGETLEVYFAQ